MRNEWTTNIKMPDAPITEIWAEIPKNLNNSLFDFYEIERFTYDALKPSSDFDESEAVS